MGDVDKLVHLAVDGLRDRGRVLGLVARTVHGERIALLGSVLDGAEHAGHAVLGDHRAGDLRRLLNVRARTRGGLAEDELLGGAAAHGEDKACEQLVAVVHALVVFLRGHGVPAGAAAREDGDLVDPLDVFERPRAERVPALVVGGDLLFLLGDDLRAAPRPADHAVGRLLERVGGDYVAADARGEKRRLVEHVGQIRAAHAGGALSQRVQVSVGAERLVLGVDLENLLAPGQVRVGHRDLAVETSRAQQRWVEDVGAVRRRDEDNALAGAETVHLHEQLVERLLALVVAAAGARAALAANGVDLVDEDDARGVLAGLLKQVAHARSADTDEHFHEVGTRDGVKRHPGLAGHGAGEQGLTGAGRAVEQHAARDLRAELLVNLRVLQKVHDLLKLVDRLVGAGDVGERVRRVVLGQLLCPRAADAEHAATGLHAVHQVEQ